MASCDGALRSRSIQSTVPSHLLDRIDASLTVPEPLLFETLLGQFGDSKSSQGLTPPLSQGRRAGLVTRHRKGVMPIDSRP